MGLGPSILLRWSDVATRACVLEQLRAIITIPEPDLTSALYMYL